MKSGIVFGQEGEIEIVETLETTGFFTRYLIDFPSDGVRVRGFMNVPFGEGAFSGRDCQSWLYATGGL